MSALFPIIFFLGAVAGIGYAIYLAILRTVRAGSIVPISRQLGFKARGTSTCQGTLKGRACEVTVAEDGTLTFLVAVERPPPFTVHGEGFGAFLERAFGVGFEVGDPGFDGKLAISSTDRSRARGALTAEMRDLVKRTFEVEGVTQIDTTFQPVHFQEKHFFAGKGVLRGRARFAQAGPHAAEILGRLVAFADLLEGVPLRVVSLGGERRAERTTEGGARCAWCHDGITGSEPDLVACDKCGTVLHEGCWAEGGACPTLGCGGKTPERGRASS